MNTTTIRGPIQVALSKRVLGPLERIATALEALVENTRPAHTIVGTVSSPLDEVARRIALTQRIAEAAHAPIVTARQEPVDGGIWVLDGEAARALPDGTILSLDGSSSAPWCAVKGGGFDIGYGTEEPFTDRNFLKGRKVLNPEILGEFRPVEIPPTHLESQEDYDAAPVGTQVRSLWSGDALLEKTPAGWVASYRPAWGPTTKICVRREVLRWGPAKALAVGDIVRTAEEHLALPVGAEISGDLAHDGEAYYTRSEKGFLDRWGNERPTDYGPLASPERGRKIISLP